MGPGLTPAGFLDKARITPVLREMRRRRQRVGIVVGGGPAPGINAVIEGAAHGFLDFNIGVVGFFDGYEWLEQVPPDRFKRNRNLERCASCYYGRLGREDISGIRWRGGSIIRTSRANPGSLIGTIERGLLPPDILARPELLASFFKEPGAAFLTPRKPFGKLISLATQMCLDQPGGQEFVLALQRAGESVKNRSEFNDPVKTRKLHNVLAVLNEMRVRMLVSIGGDDTLKTAYYLATLAAMREQPLLIVHTAKTIDADYPGAQYARQMPWTFGFHTAADEGGRILRNLRADAKTTSAYFIVRIMGRSAGWLSAATAVRGNASMVLVPEEYKDVFDPDKVAFEIARAMIEREKEEKFYGVVVVAEGLAAKLPLALRPIKADRHGNPVMGSAKVEELLAERVARAYADLKEQELGRRVEKKVVGKEVGYEVRCCDPNSYDIMLATQSGAGAFSLLREGLGGRLVTVSGSYEIGSIPFNELIGGDLRVVQRPLDVRSDFYGMVLATQSPACVAARREGIIHLRETETT